MVSLVLDSVWDFVFFGFDFFLVSLVLDLPWDFVFFLVLVSLFFLVSFVVFGFFGFCGFVGLFGLHICDDPKLETFISFD